MHKIFPSSPTSAHLTAAPDSGPTSSTHNLISGHSGGDYRLRPNVLLAVNPDFSHVLDFNRGRFYALDAIGTQMLKLTLAQSTEQVMAAIAQQYQTDEATIAEDLNSLLKQLEQQQLIQARHQTQRSSSIVANWLSPITKVLGAVSWRSLKILVRAYQWLEPATTEQTIAPGLPSRRTMTLLLSASWLSFRCFGWSRTLQLWQRWQAESFPPPALDANQPQLLIQTLDQQVREAAAWQVLLPMVCKERALVAYHVLRTYCGLPASLVVGIDRYPFHLHAWVECAGQVVSDESDRCRLFTPVIVYPDHTPQY